MFQKNAIFFHLYTSIDAESVKVMASDNQTIHLNQAWDGNKRYWINQQPFALPNDRKVFLYRYVATFQKGPLKRFFHYILSGYGESPTESITERGWRRLSDGTNLYDIFHFSANKDSNQCLFAGFFFFIDMLYYKLSAGGRKNFLQILIECENVDLGTSRIEKADTMKFFKWIEQVTSKGSTWHHAVFVCAILGKMVKQVTNHHEIFHWMPPKTADRILHLLTASEYGHIPQSIVEMIRSIAIHLLTAGSHGGWLAFLSYFANLFDADRLLRFAASLPMEYPDEHFNSLAGYVVDFLKTLAVSDRRKICNYVVSNCNSIRCLWHLYRELSVNLPDILNVLSERFSERFCRLITCRTRAQKIDLLQVNYWEMTPSEMRNKLADQFVDALHHQIEHNNLSKETLVTLRRYTADEHICASKSFVSLILCLTQNRNEDVIRTLVDLLNSKIFFAAWKSWSYNEKSDICISLLKTMFQFQNPLGRRSFREKVIQVLEAERKICETYAVQRDQKIILALEECAIKLLQNGSIKYILDAFVDIDTSSQIMQSCYSSVLRDAVKRCGASGDISQIKTLLHLLEVREKDYKKDLHSLEFEG